MPITRPVCLFTLLGVMHAGVAMADLSTRVRFNIAPQSLSAALIRYAEQSQIQVTSVSNLVDGLNTAGVTGELRAVDALDVLLENTGLTYQKIDESTVAIRVASALQPTAGSPASPAQSGGAAAGERIRWAQADTATVAPASSPLEDSQRREILEEIRVIGRPFTDANVDIVRTEDDVQAYYLFRGEEVAQSNVPNLEQYLKERLSMNSLARSSAEGNTNAGYSSVNLRGLGTNQTLILINGRRVAATEPGWWGASQFDLNSFDPSTIDRIEVLPSSASAIYGGSAVGGVLNVILKRDFTGGNFRLTYDTPLDTNAPVRGMAGAYGWSLEDGRTHITLNASYQETESLLFGDRSELIGRGFARVRERSPALLYGPNSPYAYPATTNITSADGSNLVLKDGTPLGSAMTYVPFGVSPQTSPADLRAGLLANAGSQDPTLPSLSGNPWSDRTLQVEPVVKFASGAARRKMTDNLELIGEVFYASRDAEHPSDANGLLLTYPASSPVNPFQQAVRVRAPMENPRSYSHESLRVVGGFVLDLPHEWRVQGDYTWNKSESSISYMSYDAASASAASAAAAANGSLNLFVDTSAYPDALRPSVFQTQGDRIIGEGSTSLADIGVRMSGPIGHLPAGQPNLTIGLGHRVERMGSGLNEAGGLGRYTYFPQSQRVASVYAEGLVPLVAPSNDVWGVRRLDLQLATRYEDFSVSSGTSFRVTYPPNHVVDPNEVIVSQKVDYSATNKMAGLRYQPIESLTLRASYATAFLPPSFSDLLPGVFTGNYSVVQDPKRGNQTVTVPFLLGGNPDLEPLSAKTWTVGLIFKPDFLPGWRMSLEWYRIERSDVTLQPTSRQLLANEDQFPGRVTRETPAPGDPYGVGPITQLDRSLISAANVSTEGVDFSLHYHQPTQRYGTFSVDLLGTAVDSFTQVLALGSPAQEAVNQIWNGGPLAFRANATVGWQQGNWSLSWTSLYFGSYDQFNNPLNIAAQGGTTVPSQIYHNFMVGYQFEPAGATSHPWSDLEITLGIRNVFNTLPPFDVGGAAGYGYFSPFGDARLRTAQLTLAKRF